MAANLYRVIVPVCDMDRADAFWSGLLQLELDPVAPTRHYLHTGGAILALVDPREHGRRHRTSPDWLTFRVPDLDAIWQRARELGCPAPEGDEGEGIHTRPWGERSFYTNDPFGNPLCFSDDVRSETPPAWSKYAGSPIANLTKTVLPTRDLPRSGAFFADLLGVEVDTEVENRHFVYCDSCILALVDPIEHGRMHGLAPAEFRANPELVYFAVADLEATYARARTLGMGSLAADDVGEGIQKRPWGERSFYGVDPSGNPICLVDDQTLFTGAAAS